MKHYKLADLVYLLTHCEVYGDIDCVMHQFFILALNYLISVFL